MQMDPVGDKSDIDLYSYVGDDATDKRDPSGLDANCLYTTGCNDINPGPVAGATLGAAAAVGVVAVSAPALAAGAEAVVASASNAAQQAGIAAMLRLGTAMTGQIVEQGAGETVQAAVKLLPEVAEAEKASSVPAIVRQAIEQLKSLEEGGDLEEAFKKSAEDAAKAIQDLSKSGTAVAVGTTSASHASGTDSAQHSSGSKNGKDQKSNPSNGADAPFIQRVSCSFSHPC
jgi:hypothetical protein